jgi:hypothetical protein
MNIDIASERPDQTPVVANPRKIAAYTHGYNHTWFAGQARGIYAKIQDGRGAGHEVNIIAKKGSEGVVLAACAASVSGSVKSVQLENDTFRFVDLSSYRDPNFVPGAVKYGDLPGLIATVKNLGTEVVVAE